MENAARSSTPQVTGASAVQIASAREEAGQGFQEYLASAALEARAAEAAMAAGANKSGSLGALQVITGRQGDERGALIGAIILSQALGQRKRRYGIRSIPGERAVFS
jgi:hypothetical protein